MYQRYRNDAKKRENVPLVQTVQQSIGVVDVIDRVRIGRRVPGEELEKFRLFCEDSAKNPHEEASEAVLEYLPQSYVPAGYRTEWHEVEAQLKQDLESADLLGHSSMKKTSTEENQTDPLENQPRRLCQIHIDQSLLQALEKYTVEVHGTTHGTLGVEFARAMRAYRGGGKAKRVHEFYSRLRNNVQFSQKVVKTG